MSRHIDLIRKVTLPGNPRGTLWDVCLAGPKIDAIVPHDDGSPSHTYATLNGRGALLAPSLCHPRVRLDATNFSSEHQALHKSIEPNAKDLLPQWAEGYGLSMTGYRKIHGLLAAGVTHMRALVEVKADDSGMRILDAAVEMRNRLEQEGRCIVQICAMFRWPLISSTVEENDAKDGVAFGKLRDEMADLPVTLVYTQSGELRNPRDVLGLIRDHGIRVCFGVEASDDISPIAESYDPVKSIGIDDDTSQELEEADAELLYECVCRRPRQAIGHGKKMIQGLELKVGAVANFVLFDRGQTIFTEVLSPYAECRGRQVLLQGCLVAGGE